MVAKEKFHLYSFSMTTVISYYKFSDLNKTNIFFHCSVSKTGRSHQAKIKMLVDGIPFWALEKRINFIAFSSFWRLSVLLVYDSLSLSSMPSNTGQGPLTLPSLWLFLFIVSSTFKDSCDGFGPTQLTQDNLPILKSVDE